MENLKEILGKIEPEQNAVKIINKLKKGLNSAAKKFEGFSEEKQKAIFLYAYYNGFSYENIEGAENIEIANEIAKVAQNANFCCDYCDKDYWQNIDYDFLVSNNQFLCGECYTDKYQTMCEICEEYKDNEDYQNAPNYVFLTKQQIIDNECKALTIGIYKERSESLSLEYVIDLLESKGVENPNYHNNSFEIDFIRDYEFIKEFDFERWYLMSKDYPKFHEYANNDSFPKCKEYRYSKYAISEIFETEKVCPKCFEQLINPKKLISENDFDNAFKNFCPYSKREYFLTAQSGKVFPNILNENEESELFKNNTLLIPKIASETFLLQKETHLQNTVAYMLESISNISAIAQLTGFSAEASKIQNEISKAIAKAFLGSSNGFVRNGFTVNCVIRSQYIEGLYFALSGGNGGLFDRFGRLNLHITTFIASNEFNGLHFEYHGLNESENYSEKIDILDFCQKENELFSLEKTQPTFLYSVMRKSKNITGSKPNAKYLIFKDNATFGNIMRYAELELKDILITLVLDLHENGKI